MLINNEDFQKSVKVSGAFEFSQVETEINSVQRNVIKFHLGATLHDELETAYAAVPTEDQTKLLNLIHPVLSRLSLWMATDILNVHITDNGFQSSHSGDMKPAFEWQVRNAKNTLRKTGFSALEELLAFLEENQDTYPDWESSEASNNSRDLIINSAKAFSDFVTVDRNVFALICPLQKRIMRVTIKELLGTDLYDDIMTDIKTGAPNPDNLVLMEDLSVIAAHASYAEALEDLPVIVDGEGVHFFNSAFSGNFSGKEPGDKSYIHQLVSKNKGIAKSAYENLVCFLNENTDTYPLFLTSGNYTAPVAEDDEEEEEDDDSGIYGLG
jgi:hypothetical protein